MTPEDRVVKALEEIVEKLETIASSLNEISYAAGKFTDCVAQTSNDRNFIRVCDIGRDE